MAPEDIDVALRAVNMIGTAALGVWFYLEKRSDKTNERVSALAQQVERMDKGLTALQSNVAGSPNHADLAKVYESINSLAATVHQLVGENRGQTDTLRLILNQITQKGMQ